MYMLILENLKARAKHKNWREGEKHLDHTREIPPR